MTLSFLKPHPTQIAIMVLVATVATASTSPSAVAQSRGNTSPGTQSDSTGAAPPIMAYRQLDSADQADTCDVSASGIIWGASLSEPEARPVSAGGSALPEGAVSFSWGISQTSTARRPRVPPSVGAHNIMQRTCAQALSSLQALHLDAAATAQLDQAFEASDGATVTQVMAAAGFDPAIVPDVSFHAVNTKGTGANNNRTPGGGVTHEDTWNDGHSGYRIRITLPSSQTRRNSVGHVTLMR